MLVFSPGSAIAYLAYVFPDTLMHTLFHDCYLSLAVLNTLFSTGLACYSRYWCPPQGNGEGSSSISCGPWERPKGKSAEFHLDLLWPGGTGFLVGPTSRQSV